VLDAHALPSDVESLKRLLLEREATVQARDVELREKQRQIEHLKLQLAKLRRARFGQSSEALKEAGQLPLTLEELEAAVADALLRAGVPAEMIALWLGHEQLTTTHGYIEADLTMKQQCLEKLRKPAARQPRRPRDSHLLEFLQAL
jgi:integrase